MAHDELDVLVLQTFSIDIFVIIVVILLGISSIDNFALAVIMEMVMAGVVMAGVIMVPSRGQLLGSGSLSLRIEILDFSFTEDAVDLIRYRSVSLF